MRLNDYLQRVRVVEPAAPNVDTLRVCTRRIAKRFCSRTCRFRRLAASAHMVLRVMADGEPWLADVGFGGLNLVDPMPLSDGAAQSLVLCAWCAVRP